MAQDGVSGGSVFADGRIERLKEFLSPDQLYHDLIERVRKYQPNVDISLIQKAYEVADEAHKEQVRKSGEPYIIHPLYVAIILADLELDKETIIAGLLHDVVEDTVMSGEDLARVFGADVAALVDGVTKLDKLPKFLEGGDNRLEMQAENLRKMFLAMAKDIRVILIKLADRLHNMRTLKHMPPEKQQRIARETLEIYSPIAERLGISRVKIELDDLSLKYLEPDVYYDLVDKIAIRKSVREKYIQSIVDEVSTHIKNAEIEAKVEGRIKHFFSIYRKMKNQNKSIDQIYDLFAVRIIVESVKDCYAALGIIHEMYKPIPGRFKDYIAMPKPNMYQSLHTTLIGTTGQPFEVQIRTEEMHKAAEYGIAAHWKYKEVSNSGKPGEAKKSEVAQEDKMTWLRQILEWQQDSSDNKEFLSLIKDGLDLFSESVYCFTPNGDVKTLPAGSTPIDFAYSIHSAVGNKMVGARVNGKLVTIDYVIANGDCIEILTSQNSKGPSRDWIKIAKSTQAKNKINQWFKNEFKEENITKGKEMLEGYCKTKGINISNIMQPPYKDAIMRKYGFHDWESVLAAIGHGGLKEGQIVNRMNELYDKDHKKETSDADILAAIEENNANQNAKMKSKGGITVKGMHDMAVRFSRCCSPVPGDEICGFITRGRGISIHRTDCTNIMSLPEIERGRLMEADWADMGDTKDGAFVANITVFVHNRNGMLADISKVLTEKNIDILSLNTRVSKDGTATLQTTFEIRSKEELNHIIDKLRNIPSVIDVERT